MDEQDYQLGIRKMTPHELVTLVTVYRNELIACQELCKAFARENFAQDVLHKIICGQKEAHLDAIIKDYEWAMRGQKIDE